MASFRNSLVAALAISAVISATQGASAENILGALARAYQYNSELNSARAGVRVTDEGVAIAKSGFRPTVAATGSLNYANQSGTDIRTGSFGVQINQTIFDGFQTLNNVRSAEARVRASNEALRNTEQNILFNAASAYMDVIRDRQIAVLRQRNLAFLEEQVRAARSRFEVGEGTRTDVAQADASQAAAMAQLSAARAQAESSAAVYRQIIGTDPGKLDAASPLRKPIPGGVGEAISIATAEHPAVRASEHIVDAAGFTVKSAEGALLPGVSASAGVSTSYRDASPSNPLTDGNSTAATIGATLTIPLYQGGRAAAVVRQQKESLGQARIDVDVSRDQVRAAVASAWTQFMASGEVVSASRSLVSAAQLALNGVIEERNVGQRTTLDVLNAQADVITAQINLVTAERDAVVSSYAVLSSMGRLTVERLGLKVVKHNPDEHYQAVKDKWFGLRTPDGR